MLSNTVISYIIAVPVQTYLKWVSGRHRVHSYLRHPKFPIVVASCQLWKVLGSITVDTKYWYSHSIYTAMCPLDKLLWVIRTCLALLYPTPVCFRLMWKNRYKFLYEHCTLVHPRVCTLLGPSAVTKVTVDCGYFTGCCLLRYPGLSQCLAPLEHGCD